MPSRVVVKSALLLAPLALVVSLAPRGGAQTAAAGSKDDFIVRCFFNGNIATQDPIIAPTNVNTDHLHAFFGNMAGGGSAANGTPFANMRAGDDGSAGTMENNGLASPTNPAGALFYDCGANHPGH